LQAASECGLIHLEIAKVRNADKASPINIPQIGKYGRKADLRGTLRQRLV